MGLQRAKSRKKATNTGPYQKAAPVSIVSHSVAATVHFGQKLLQLPGPSVWLLSGPVGAGKTTFVRGIVRQLGIKTTVNSPTFSLIKSYSLSGQKWRQLVHVDAYRITHPREYLALDLGPLVDDSSVLLVIEWPERLVGYAFGDTRKISFQIVSGGRKIRVA